MVRDQDPHLLNNANEESLWFIRWWSVPSVEFGAYRNIMGGADRQIRCHINSQASTKSPVWMMFFTHLRRRRPRAMFSGPVRIIEE